MSEFIIACGGTGGHLAPGIALAEALTERGHNCTLFISSKVVDARLASRYDHMEFVSVPGIGLSLKPLKFLKFCYLQLKAFYKSLQFLRKRKPDIVIGFGGFTTVGVSLASYFLGCALVLHEANRKAGKAIRLLSVLAKRVYLPPGVQLKSLPPKTIRHFGYPVRKEIRPMAKSVACKRLQVPARVKRLLVLGGSQGANSLNKWLLENFERLGEHGIHAYCVTGLGNYSQGKLQYTASSGEKVEALFAPFVDNMSPLLSASDLVISRAGAGSIAEFCRCGTPCILVPYPFAADNHQAENAKFLERQGGGIVLAQANMDKLFDEVVSIIFNDWLLDKFERNLKSMEVANSLELIANDLEKLASENQPSFLQSVLHVSS